MGSLPSWLCGWSAGAQSDQQYLQADLLQPDSLKKLNGTALRKLLAQTTEQIGCRESLYVSYFVRGLVQYRLGNYESAADDYNHVIGLDASQAGAYLNRGLAAQALHNYSAALADMNTALKLMPDNAILYSNRGYLMQAQGRYAEAFRDYDKGISLAKTDPAIHINKIRLLTQLKRYPEALAILNSLTLLNAADIRLYAERADIYHAMHEDDQAVGEWDKAVAVSGNKPEVIIGRARFKDDVINDDEGAVADCNIAISAEPANGSHYYYRARPRYDLKRYQLVVADCSKAITLDSMLYGAYVIRGDARDELGDEAAAIRDYEKAIEIDPDLASAYHELAVLYQKGRQYDKAISTCSRLLALNVRDTNLLLLRGQMYSQTGNYTAAIADYSQLIDLYKTHYPAYYLRALAYDSLRNQAAACADMQVVDAAKESLAHQYMRARCRQLLPKKELEPEDLFEQGTAKLESGDYRAGISIYDKAIALKPDSPLITALYFNRGKAKRKLEQYADAIADYRMALKYAQDVGEIWVSLGVAQQLLGQADEAVQTFKKGIAAAPEYPMSYYDLALILAEKKQQYAEAITYLKTALKYDRVYINALMLLGHCSREQGDMAAACEAYKKAATLGSGRALAEQIEVCK